MTLSHAPSAGGGRKYPLLIPTFSTTTAPRSRRLWRLTLSYGENLLHGLRRIDALALVAHFSCVACLRQSRQKVRKGFALAACVALSGN